MNAPTLAVRKVASLMKLDPDRMQLTNALLKLLSGGMEVAVCRDMPAARAFAAGDRIAFAMLSATGYCMLASNDSVDHACDVLDAADPMLRHVEARLAIAIEPTAIHAAAQTVFGDDGAIILQLRHEGLTLLFAIEPDSEQYLHWIAAANATPPDCATVPVPFVVEFEAAKLSLADAAGIAGGDMLLLPQSAKAIWHDSILKLPSHAVVEFAGMMIWPGGPSYEEEEVGMNDDGAHESTSGFQVPVTVRLPTQYVAAGTLAGLHQGGSLRLGPMVQGLPVELLVGGRRIATGEIVEIGENFAVLIDERVATPVVAPDSEHTGEVDLRSSDSDGE